ncbi:MAG: TonB-dependent receptor domain-containing protein [Sphingomonadaceae bacterium]
MSNRLRLNTLLLLSSMLVAPGVLAQTPDAPAAPPSTPPTTTAPDEVVPEVEEEVEISAPGASAGAGDEIVVTGRRFTPNSVRATPQIITVLSAEDIARTGEGDIAGALSRVTGLSVVGNGFVFVRGLGDRYSSALLNGSPLPSPEPLRRTVPLDIFPTSVVSSAVVQKTYSVNYPAEFGGGVINLTTRSIPRESFLTIGGGVSADSATTDNFGYTYRGGKRDWTGYDSGTRRVPDFITATGIGGTRIGAAQTAQLNNLETVVLQSTNFIPVNFSGELSFGHTADVFGDGRIGVIGSASFSNNWRTRDAIQQDTNSEDGALRSDFRSVITDNRAVANALLGFGLDIADHQIRWTNVYIHDTNKQARGASATIYPNTSGFERFDQSTAWFERELLNTQLVAEFDFGDFEVDGRASYANTRRDSPYERTFVSRFDPTFGAFVNALNASTEQAQVSFSELDENQYSGQLDLSYKLPTPFYAQVSGGYFYNDSQRTSSRFTFAYRYDPTGGTGGGSSGALPLQYRFLRADLLLSPAVLGAIDSALGGCPGGLCIVLDNVSGGQGASIYDASLSIHAGYAQIEAEPIPGVRGTLGIRYETAKERVATNVAGGDTVLDNDYFLPAATVTWSFAPDMQLRFHGSKTIARPQFRELAPQFYQDFDSDRLFFGNPALVDSRLLNFEARYEWFFARNQRLTAAGFYKRIDNPIEQVSAFPTLDSRITTGFSYVPSATLYGAEIELQKYFPLDGLGSPFFETRRLLVIGNYTYTQSEIKADNTPVPDINAGPGGIVLRPANLLFRDGAPLTGQSDHLVNVQIGIEDTESTSQATLLFTYASQRVTARGASNASGVGFLPDVFERPGYRLDFVARQGIKVAGTELELKFEARNLTGTKYQEFQTFSNGTRVDINRYEVGTSVALGLSAKF